MTKVTHSGRVEWVSDGNVEKWKEWLDGGGAEQPAAGGDVEARIAAAAGQAKAKAQETALEEAKRKEEAMGAEIAKLRAQVAAAAEVAPPTAAQGGGGAAAAAEEERTLQRRRAAEEVPPADLVGRRVEIDSKDGRTGGASCMLGDGTEGGVGTVRSVKKAGPFGLIGPSMHMLVFEDGRTEKMLLRRHGNGGATFVLLGDSATPAGWTTTLPQLQAFYAKHDPSKSRADIVKIMATWEEGKLLAELKVKYGEDPVMAQGGGGAAARPAAPPTASEASAFNPEAAGGGDAAAAAMLDGSAAALFGDGSG
jgi:hypothetical protein